MKNTIVPPSIYKGTLLSLIKTKEKATIKESDLTKYLKAGDITVETLSLAVNHMMIIG